VSDPLTILMTSGAGPGVVGHLDAARNNGYAPVRMVVGDVCTDANVGFALSDVAVGLPAADDPELIDALLGICREHGVDVVWPVYDGELEPVVSARGRFEGADVRLLTADEGTVRLCLDKERFYSRLADTGLVLPCRVVRSAEELRSAAGEFGYPDRRVVVKPGRATGGRGFHVLDAAFDPHAGFLAERPDATVCSLDAATDAVGEGNGDGIVVMPFVGGQEHGCDVLADGGEVAAAVTRRKLPPVREGMHTRIVVDEDEDVLSVVRRLVAELGADGLLSVDLREDDAGRLWVLEVNPRAGAYLGMACARVDLFGLALARAFGQRPGVEGFRRASEAVTGLRYWADLVQVESGPRVLGVPCGRAGVVGQGAKV